MAVIRRRGVDWGLCGDTRAHGSGDAQTVIEVLPKRFAKYGLTLHPQNTRLVEYGRRAYRRVED
jgi:hypothetical protein